MGDAATLADFPDVRDTAYDSGADFADDESCFVASSYNILLYGRIGWSTPSTALFRWPPFGTGRWLLFSASRRGP